IYSALPFLVRSTTGEIVRERDDRDERDDRHPDDRRALVDLARHRAAPYPLDERERDVTAVERQERQQIEKRERHAHESQNLEVVVETDSERRGGNADDADGARELSLFVAREEAADRLAGSG